MTDRKITYYLSQAPIIFIILTTSFAAVCIETTGSYLFSIRFGYIYLHISLLTSVLFSGASLGCAAVYLYLKGAPARARRFLIVTDIVMISLILLLIYSRGSLLGYESAYYTLLALTGMVLGGQFSAVAAVIVKEDHIGTDSGHLYAVDLMGAGIFLFVLFRYFPLLGIDAVLYSALAAKAASFILFSFLGAPAGDEEAVNAASETRTVRNPLFYIIPFIYGAAMIATQSLMIRLMLVNVGHSYISFGVPIGIWLIGAAAGSYSAAFSGMFKRDGLCLTVITLCACTLPALVFAFLYYAWEFKSVEFNLAFFSALIFFISFVSGMIFPLICHSLKEKAGVYITYVLEGAGAVTGGILFAFYNFGLSDFSLSLISALMILLMAILLCFYSGKKTAAFIISAIYVLCAGIFAMHAGLDTIWLQNQQKIRNEDILFYKYTKSGRVEAVIEKANKNIAVYIDRVLQYSSADHKMHNESMAIFSYYFAKNPADALVIGGGAGGLARELLRFDLRSLDYIEIEPELKVIGKRYFSDILGDVYDDKRLNTVNGDGYRFLKDVKKTYDMIMIDLPSPSNLQLSRFFTKEFFEMVAEKLNPGGVFMLPLLDPLSFPGEKYVNYNVHNTLSLVFGSKRVLLPFYYIPKIKGARVESDFIMKPYFELVICSTDDRIERIDKEALFSDIKGNEALRRSQFGQEVYIDLLLKVSKVYYDMVYANYDYKGVSTLDRLEPLHMKWKFSRENINTGVMIGRDSAGNVIITGGE